MSSQYALYEINKISEIFAPSAGVPKGVKPHYNITPAQMVVAIVNRDGVKQIETMKWGFIPYGAKDTNSIFRYKTYNARAEDVLSKPTWRSSIRTSRCLIPANGFYEYKTLETGKRPYYIHLDDASIFAFAGVYGTWTDPEGNKFGMCSIITTNTDTDDDMMPSRIPVIVRPEDQDDWLNPEIEDANTILRIMTPYDLSKIKIIPVSDDVKSAKIDKPYLIERLVR